MRQGLSGLECLSGIPGSAGATPIQNVGAYGQEVAETIAAVRVYDRVADEVRDVVAGGVRVRVPDQRLQAQRPLGGAVGRLPAGALAAVGAGPLRGAGPRARRRGGRPGAAGRRTRRRCCALRAGKGMVLDPADPDTCSVGSFFTNPVLDAARVRGAAGARCGDLGEPPSWPGDRRTGQGQRGLADRAGRLRPGLRRPAAASAMSSKHTLALTNRGGGTTAALLALAREIRDGVHARFGVTLHPEPVLVGCEL